MHALIVEDDQLVARDFAALVQRYGAQTVAHASDAEGALAAADARHPDVALVDIRIDGPVDGLIVGETLALSGIPVIYVSGEIDEAVLWNRHYAIDVLRKPVTEPELRSALATALAPTRSG